VQLLAVIVPPPEVVRDLLEAAHRLCTTETAGSAAPSRSLADRVLGRNRTVAPAAPPTLVPVTPEAVFVRLAKFGNVTGSDVDLLARALDSVAGTWPTPVLRATGLTVAEDEPHEVTARLDGDVDGLREIYRNVNEVARQQRFFLDRRTFSSELRLGTLGVGDPTPVPAALAGVEAPHAGPHWSPTSVTLVRASFVASGTTYAEVAQVALAPGEEDLGASTGA